MPLILWVIAYAFVGAVLGCILSELYLKVEQQPMGLREGALTILLWPGVLLAMVVILVSLIREAGREN